MRRYCQDGDHWFDGSEGFWRLPSDAAQVGVAPGVAPLLSTDKVVCEAHKGDTEGLTSHRD